MRIVCILVLLLSVSARPSWAQDAQLPASSGALPAGLTPAAGTPASGPVALQGRDHGSGAGIGSVIGAVAGLLVANFIVCTAEGGEGDAEQICKLAGIGLGAVVGAIVGLTIGAPHAGGSASSR
jgi:hypothetical protein